jgi:hypothetical protein
MVVVADWLFDRRAVTGDRRRRYFQYARAG